MERQTASGSMLDIPGVELYKIKMLRLPRRDESLILGGNALRLIRRVRNGRERRRAPGAISETENESMFI